MLTCVRVCDDSGRGVGRAIAAKVTANGSGGKEMLARVALWPPDAHLYMINHQFPWSYCELSSGEQG